MMGVFGDDAPAAPLPGFQIPGLPLPGATLPPPTFPDFGGIQTVQPAPVQGRNLQAFTLPAVQLLGPLLAAFDGRIEKSGGKILIHVSKAQSLPGSLGAAALGLRTKGLGILFQTDIVQRLTRIGTNQDDGTTIGYATDDLDDAAALGATFAVFYQPATWRTYNVFQKHPLATAAGVGILGIVLVMTLKGKR
jgi:hypothetical protein